ncbi:Mur ligase family protein [bacterium]|nr:Mur ligase family protein [bacterium]MDC0272382.1 Mur ligase family protein [Crocinitomicaceae bacterium]MDC0459739.1 Mur ligase family protein [Crocinitomicaceae bacterium]
MINLDINYSEHIDWLFQQFPAFQKQGGKAYKPGLSHTQKLLSLFDLDLEKLQYIHVAGTNGKGSVCSVTASLLTEQNHKVGLFTSPHLFDFRERIRVNGAMISEQEVVAFCETIRNTKLDFKPSFFEITFVLAIRHFTNQNCDYVVLETGMGGRLDATNVVKPLISVITNIGLDHQQHLGNTLQDIAIEKAGIIKGQTPVIIGKKQGEVYAVFEQVSSEQKAPIYIAKESYTDAKLPKYQLENVNTAISALSELHIECSEEIIQKSLSNIYKNTGYQKRMEIVQDKPTIIVDTSHNKEGLEITLDEIREKYKGKIYCIFGSTNEREVNAGFMNIFNHTHLYFCTFSNERSKTVEDWNTINVTLNQSIEIHTDINPLFNEVRAKLSPNDVLLVTGSFFLLSDLNFKSNK